MVLFLKSVYFDDFIFKVGIYFEVFVAVLLELLERDDITKFPLLNNTVCSVTLTVIPETTCSRVFVTANLSWPCVLLILILTKPCAH